MKFAQREKLKTEFNNGNLNRIKSTHNHRLDRQVTVIGYLKGKSDI